MWKFIKDQKGITGLETAIVLIAFVVVASVFAFAVITTGLFSAEAPVSTTPTAAEMEARQDSERLANLQEQGFEVTTTQEAEDLESLLELLRKLGIDVPKFGVVEIPTLRADVVE